jgi:hypothetical protein
MMLTPASSTVPGAYAAAVDVGRRTLEHDIGNKPIAGGFAMDVDTADVARTRRDVTRQLPSTTSSSRPFHASMVVPKPPSVVAALPASHEPGSELRNRVESVEREQHQQRELRRQSMAERLENSTNASGRSPRAARLIASRDQ